MPDTFEEWEAKVDTIVQKVTGIGCNDGCDWPSRDTYDQGATPLGGALMWAESQDLLPDELLLDFEALSDEPA